MAITCRRLGAQEAAVNAGFTHEAIITADNLTETAANTVQTLLLATLATGDVAVKVGWALKTAFKDASDATFNVTTMSIGDNTAVTTHLAAFELNENGTEIFYKFSNTAVGPYTAANKVTATFTSMAAKALNDIDTGEVHVYFQILRMADLLSASSGQILTVPK